MTTIAWGAIQWFDGYQKANQASYLRDMLKWGTDWIIQAHPDANTFYVQVGDGSIDNNYWGNVKNNYKKLIIATIFNPEIQHQ